MKFPLAPATSCAALFYTFIARLCATGWANAQANYPSRPIRVIVPFPPGGGTDLMARAIALRDTQTWGQPVIVDNRAGGGGNIGTNIVGNSPAEFAKIIKDDFARWAGVIKAAGVKVE